MFAKLFLLLIATAGALATEAESGKPSDIIKKHLSNVEVNENNGGKLYKTFFEIKPGYLSYFGLPENTSTTEIEENQRFKTLGKLFLEKLKRIVDASDNDEKLKKELEGLKLDHDPRNIGLEQLKESKSIIAAFLQNHAGGLTEEQKTAWNEMFKKFEEIYKSLPN